MTIGTLQSSSPELMPFTGLRSVLEPECRNHLGRTRGTMSILKTRVRRVYTGWRALPGKNLLVFNDAVAVVRASGLDGMPFAGGSGLAIVGAVGAVAGMRRIGSKKNRAMVPGSEVVLTDLLASHPDNWAIPTSEIVAAQLHWSHFRGKLTLSHGDTETVVVFEKGPNPKAQVEGALGQVLGDRFHTS
jgi:hypothetical protein